MVNTYKSLPLIVFNQFEYQKNNSYHLVIILIPKVANYQQKRPILVNSDIVIAFLTLLAYFWLPLFPNSDTIMRNSDNGNQKSRLDL